MLQERVTYLKKTLDIRSWGEKTRESKHISQVDTIPVLELEEQEKENVKSETL